MIIGRMKMIKTRMIHETFKPPPHDPLNKRMADTNLVGVDWSCWGGGDYNFKTFKPDLKCIKQNMAKRKGLKITT